MNLINKISFLFLIAFLAAACGNGGERSIPVNTPVSITVTEAIEGQSLSNNIVNGAAENNVSGNVAESSSGARQLSMCRFTITGPGMDDIVREVDVAGKTSIKETFNVPSGLNRSFLIQMFVENSDMVLYQAQDDENLEGEPLELKMELKETSEYSKPPVFNGIKSISNSATRSVMLNWEPATDNITAQERIQYRVFLTTKSERDKADENDIMTVYTWGSSTNRDKDPLMTYEYADGELILISYEYEGALPDDEQTSSDRLEPGMPYSFVVRASDEWGFEEENVEESGQIIVYWLDVAVQGSGTVTSAPEGINCRESEGTCSEDFLVGIPVVLTAKADEGSQFEGWTGYEQCNDEDQCEVMPADDLPLITASFCSLTRYYMDSDGDGYGATGNFVDSCIEVANHVTDGTDCDDSNYGINSAATEVCGNDIDENCDGVVEGCTVDCTDGDGDQYGIGEGCLGSDCDDSNASINPGASEVCDGVDNDCDNSTDEGGNSLCDDGQYCNGQETCGGVNGCQAGTDPCPSGTTCSESTDTCPVDCTDNDGDGYAIEGGNCGSVDCDDNDNAVNPDASEVCDGVDNDCDNSTDEGGNSLCDNGQFCDGSETCAGTSGCQAGTDPCPSGTTCNESTDSCPLNCTDNDGDGFGANGAASCTNDGVDCNDNNASINPGATEVCDEVDNDCDSNTPDGSGESWYGTPTSCGTGVCASTGALECWGGEQDDTCTPLNEGIEGPPGDPSCSDNRDNDCDDLIDNADTDDCVDTEPPTFSGLQSATLDCGANPDAIDLSWPAATDNVTPQNEILYRVCWDTQPLSYSGGDPDCNDIIGGTSYSVNSFKGQNLSEDQLYYVGVTPQDNAGNWAFNNAVLQVTVDCQSNKYIDNGNGTVTDIDSALMWQKEDDNNVYTWYKANGYYDIDLGYVAGVCEDSTLAGYTDWRLPTKDELAGLVYCGPNSTAPSPMPDIKSCSSYGTYQSPTIDTAYFPSTNEWWYWSSTTSLNDSTDAWTVAFYNGAVTRGSKAGYNFVRCVRGGGGIIFPPVD